MQKAKSVCESMQSINGLHEDFLGPLFFVRISMAVRRLRKCESHMFASVLGILFYVPDDFMLIRLIYRILYQCQTKSGHTALDLSIRVSVHTPVASYTCGLD